MAAVFGDVVVLRAMAEPLIGIDEVKAFPDSLARVLGGEPIRLGEAAPERAPGHSARTVSTSWPIQ
jgi:hypothetical protein